MSEQNSRTLPTPTDDQERKLLADVEEYGWHVVAVAADDEGPGFAYSVGFFHTFGHPEVIVFGLDTDIMIDIINGIGDQIEAGEALNDLDESGDVLEGYNIFFRTVEHRHYPEYYGCALWFYQGATFPALQCIWPDAEHHYPWHPECEPGLAAQQPLLAAETSWPYQAGKNRAILTTKPVIQDQHPVLLVAHDDDGDWQFLCGTTNEPDDGQLVCLGDILDRDPTLAEVADLPEGWCAAREAVGAAWTRELMDPEEDEDES